MEYINFEHNETAAELVRSAYDTPPLAFVHSYGCQQNATMRAHQGACRVDIGYGLCDKPRMQTSSSSTPAPCGSTPSSACSAMWVR